MAVSVQIAVDIKGDYEWSPEEQEYHEQFIDQFTFRLEKSLKEGNFPDRAWLKINLHYLADKRLFKLHSSESFQDRVLSHIKQDVYFRKYFI